MAEKRMPGVPGLWRAKSSSGGSFGIYTSIRTPGLPAVELKGHVTAIGFKLLPLSGAKPEMARRAAGSIQSRLTPERTLDPSAILHCSRIVQELF
jgi:hypothetical protein